MSPLADALGVVRLAIAAVLPRVLCDGVHGTRPWLAGVLVGIAIVTDAVDGPLARRAGEPTRHGALLDNLADIAVVLTASATGAGLGLVPWVAPAAMAVAFALYLAASGRVAAGWRPARSRLGHAAGVCNYALAVAVALAVAAPALRPAVRAAGLLVAAVDVVAALARLMARRAALVTLR